ncbi:acetate/propionate family kinase [Silvibacterium acidisoli]|uniref:acetate/propionate family kinase n=1 Tax=Acidobacteriaceae bacterium ZG23-2 TaxID=2883246 RepID=UPI00406D2690
MSGSSGAILAVNSGSSTLKFGLFQLEEGEEKPLFEGSAEGIGKDAGRLEIKDGSGKTVHHEEQKYTSQDDALQHVCSTLPSLQSPEPAAVGHRLVHGGPRLREHALLTPQVFRALQEAVHFAPLHIPTSLELIRSAEKLYPKAPQFACFDTTFHTTLPEIAWHYPLPEKLVAEGVRRYGFHGLSYASIVHQLGSQMKPLAVVAHLGNGSSLCAMRDGKSIDTSMGMTPTGGIPMGTRTGDLDPGVLLYLMRVHNLDADQLEAMLNHESGLLALGGSADMRDLEQRSAAGDTQAALAIEIFTLSIAKTIVAYAVELGGLDQLIFAGGIGEHSARARSAILKKLSHFGLVLAPGKNDSASDVISSSNSRVEVRIVPSKEESQIAREVRSLL